MRAFSDFLWMLFHAWKLSRILSSGLFDCRHYRAQTGESVARFGRRRLLCDYLRRGWGLKRTPGDWLDPAIYAASRRALEDNHPGVRGIFPRPSELEHYVYVGRYWGLATRPFDESLCSPPAVAATRRAGRIAAVLHVYYADQWPELAAALRKIGEPVDLFVSLVRGATDHLAETIAAEFPNGFIGVFPNHGRDILPFLQILDSGALDAYELALKLHTKRSLHLPAGDDWRRRLLLSLVAPGPSGRPLALEAMDADPAIGVLCPRGTLRGADAWKRCRPRTMALAARAGIEIDDRSFRFVAGTMFWFRPAALAPIRRLALRPADFEMEAGQLDGAASHALERLFAAAAASEGFLVRELGPPAPVPSATRRARPVAKVGR